MSFKEQQKLIDVLKKYESKMERKDLEDFKLFVKRQKDDEDFDTLSMKRLKELHDKYYVPADRSKLDDLFKKKNDS